MYSISILQSHYNANGGRNGFNYYKLVKTEPLTKEWREIAQEAQRGDRTFVIHESGSEPLDEKTNINIGVPLPEKNGELPVPDEALKAYAMLVASEIDALLK